MKLRSMGDTVLMTAPILEVQKFFPKSEIHIAVSSEWSSLFDEFPGIHKVWVYKRHSNLASRARAIANLSLKLRKEKFDCVVCLHASPSSAWIAFAAGSSVRSIHFHGHQDKNRYSTVEIPGKGKLKPVIERDMDAIRALGVHVPEGRMPKLFLEESEKNNIQSRLKEMQLLKPILGIGLGASRPTKQWPVEKFADLAALWCEKMGGSVLAIAGANESELTQYFYETVQFKYKNHSNKIQVFNRFTVRELAATLSQFSVFVSNDSGPKHIAVSVETPTVTVFGPEHPYEWHPYPRDKYPYFFIENLSCRKDADPGMPAWCGLSTCVTEKHRCMNEIGVRQVFEECARIMK